VGGWEGQGGWRGRVGELMMPIDTADQIVYTVDQTDGHSSPDHTTRKADIKWNSLGPQTTILMHPNGPTRTVFVLRGLIESEKNRL